MVVLIGVTNSRVAFVAIYLIVAFVVCKINQLMAPILMKYELKLEVNCINICEYLFPRGTKIHLIKTISSKFEALLIKMNLAKSGKIG